MLSCQELNLSPAFCSAIDSSAIKQIANGKSPNVFRLKKPFDQGVHSRGKRIKSDIEFLACLFVTKNCLLLGLGLQVLLFSGTDVLKLIIPLARLKVTFKRQSCRQCVW